MTTMVGVHRDCVEYRPAPARPDRYRVGSNGVVQSLSGAGWNDLRTFKRGKGYHVVQLATGGGEARRFNVAHLVLEAFVGPRGPGQVCRHLDGDRDNNAADNLRWGTLSENVRDSIVHGTHGVTRLTPADIRSIRGSEETSRAIAGRFGVKPSYICQIRARKIWGWVD